eukprot:scaffold22004_cov92-Isochrysis_galbana.AAC.6
MWPRVVGWGGHTIRMRRCMPCPARRAPRLLEASAPASTNTKSPVFLRLVLSPNKLACRFSSDEARASAVSVTRTRCSFCRSRFGRYISTSGPRSGFTMNFGMPRGLSTVTPTLSTPVSVPRTATPAEPAMPPTAFDAPAAAAATLAARSASARMRPSTPPGAVEMASGHRAADSGPAAAPKPAEPG